MDNLVNFEMNCFLSKARIKVSAIIRADLYILNKCFIEIFLICDLIQ